MYLLLYDKDSEDTSAIVFRPDRSISLAVYGPKVGSNELDRASLCKWDDGILHDVTDTCGSITVLVVPKMGQLSESGTLPECKIVLVTQCFAILVYIKKTWCKITWCSQKGTDVLKWDIAGCHVFYVPRLVCPPFIQTK